MSNIPHIYAYIYYKLKERNPSSYVSASNMNFILHNTIRHSIPSYLAKYVIEDMIKLGLIKRINYNRTYKILNNKCYEKIKKIVVFYS